MWRGIHTPPVDEPRPIIAVSGGIWGNIWSDRDSAWVLGPPDIIKLGPMSDSTYSGLAPYIFNDTISIGDDNED